MPALPTNSSKGFSIRPCIRNFSSKPFDADCAIAKLLRVALVFDFETELLKRFNHDLGVFAPKRALKVDLTVRQRRENERAVRDALRAGHGDFRAHRFVERHNFDEFR